MNEYWFFIDDSGKWRNKNDSHCTYGGIVFSSKTKMDKFFDLFKNKLLKVTSKKELKSCPKSGNGFFKRLYNYRKTPSKKLNYENIIKCYELCDFSFFISGCKNNMNNPHCEVEDNSAINPEVLEKLRCNMMLKTLFAELLTNNVIKKNSKINIILDNEKLQTFSKNLGINDLKDYLNENYSKDKTIRYFRNQNLFFEEVNYVDSQDNFGVQASDYIAYLGLQMVNNKIKKGVKLFLDLYKNYNRIIHCNFPKRGYNVYEGEDYKYCSCWTETGI